MRGLLKEKDGLSLSNKMAKETEYSRTPLAKKLGIKPGFTIRIINAPEHYFNLFTDLLGDLNITNDAKDEKDFIHYFCTEIETLNKEISQLRSELKSNGMIWVSWYKKSAKITTDVTEDGIRNIALKNGLVDIKVCAVDEVWSGLKLVIPLKEREHH
jgi:hypothetical protein